MISERIQDIKNRIQRAAQKAGRDPSQITLLAVSKGQPIEKIREAIEAGQRDFGENYAQEMLEHIENPPSPPFSKGGIGGFPIRWHFIGHLQRNKVKAILPHSTLIQSVDSFELAQEIEKRAAALGKTQDILIEINLGGEPSKSGADPDRVEELARALSDLPHLRLEGLMTIPPFREDPEAIRPFFKRLREIRDALNQKKVYKIALRELSMGMTHDFEAAVEEGATIIRVGTGIFGERKK